MTGTSARETSRPAKRPRPSATDRPTNVAPPVLFRLPSISPPAHDENHFGSSAAMPQGTMESGALAMGTAASAAAPLATSPSVASRTPSSRTAAALAAASGAVAAAMPALADKKAAGQRLFNTLIAIVLLVALVIISMLAFSGGQPATESKFAEGQSSSKDQLESLSDIRVPELSSAHQHSASSSNAATPVASAQTASHSGVSASGPQLSLDKPKLAGGSSAGERPGLTLNAADLAKKPSGATAQVQLGTPIPMRGTGNAGLASQESATPTADSSLPLTTPRYETVSTPSSAAGVSIGNSSSDTGASPSLWDGAKKSAEATGGSQPELMQPGSNDSELSLIPSDYASGSAKPTSQQSVASKSSAPTSSSAPIASADSSSLGVTVGAGVTEPEFPQPKATATPDLDVATLSSQFLEYSRQKNVMVASTSTELVNPYAPATSSPPATTVSTNAYATGAQPQSPAGAGVPYGTTGATLTPYVRNAPTAATPSGLGNAGSSTGATNPAAAATQSQYPTGNPTMNSPMSGPSTVYPSLSAPGAGYPPASAPNAATGFNAGSSMNAGYSAQAGAAGGFAIPPRGTANGSSQMAAGGAGAANNFAQSGAYGSPTTQNYGYATAPAANAAYQSAPVSSSPYPGGQAPQGMIGQSGFATAPSGDVAPPIPVSGTIGYGASPTR